MKLVLPGSYLKLSWGLNSSADQTTIFKVAVKFSPARELEKYVAALPRITGVTSPAGVSGFTRELLEKGLIEEIPEMQYATFHCGDYTMGSFRGLT